VAKDAFALCSGLTHQRIMGRPPSQYVINFFQDRISLIGIIVYLEFSAFGLWKCFL